MAEKKECPECGGKKVLPGTCSCDQEWQGTQIDEEFQDCICAPEVKCPACNGTGYVEE